MGGDWPLCGSTAEESSVREVALDTETTGLEPAEGHRVIEIGCVEIVNRRITDRTFHTLLQPDREIDTDAVAVHGISAERLYDQPRFPEVVDRLLAFLAGARLIIHNAPFDLGFLNHELRLIEPKAETLESRCSVLDTLPLARRLHPGQRASLDALCKRYGIDNSTRDKHGALLDARLLAQVYLAMTSGQVALSLDSDSEASHNDPTPGPARSRQLAPRAPLRVLRPSSSELAAHLRYLERLEATAGAPCLFRRLEPEPADRVSEDCAPMDES